MPNTPSSKTPLRKAIDRLIADGKVHHDTELAEKIGISKSTLSGYTNGKVSPRFRKKFEDMFEINLDDFAPTPNIVRQKKDRQPVELDDLAQAVYNVEAMVSVVLSALAEMQAKQPDETRSSSMILTELTAGVSRLYNEKIRNKE